MIALWLAGCAPEVPDPPALLETGWFSTTFDPGAENCPDRFVSSIPEDGTSGWYWRDRPVLYTATALAAAYDAWLETADGARLPGELVWDDTGLQATLEWDGWLEPNTTYTLGSLDCAGLYETTFTTSDLGLPLALAESETLQGRAYLLDFVGAEWVEPSQLGALLSLFFNKPVLLGVMYVDQVHIDLLGAQGDVDTNGVVSQDLDQPAWDFALADFSEAPFVQGSSPEVTFQYAQGNTVVDVPVTSMELQGTFSADGTVWGGGVISGMGDTRNLGPIIGDDDNPSALCDLASGLGVQCQACPDGEPYCLRLRAEHMVGTYLPGLALVDTGG